MRARRLARASVCTLPNTTRPDQSSRSALTTEVGRPVTRPMVPPVLLDQLVGVLQHQEARGRRIIGRLLADVEAGDAGLAGPTGQHQQRVAVRAVFSRAAATAAR